MALDLIGPSRSQDFPINILFCPISLLMTARFFSIASRAILFLFGFFFKNYKEIPKTTELKSGRKSIQVFLMVYGQIHSCNLRHLYAILPERRILKAVIDKVNIVKCTAVF